MTLSKNRTLFQFDQLSKALTEYRKTRRLDDSELDSGDDEGRQDRAGSQEEIIQVQKEEIIQPLRLPRHVVPEPDDNEVDRGAAVF